MNQSKQTLFALEDAGGQRLLPERRAYNERLAYFESRKASLEELYADFFTDYPLEGGGWFSQANIVECMTLFGRRMAAMGKLLREMYLVYSTSTMLRGGDGARLFVSESQRRRLLALAQECDDIDEVWSKNPVRERLQQQLSTPEGLQTFRQIQAKQETTSTWSSWKAWLGSWVNKKTIALVAFAYWLWWRCPTIEDGMEKKACGWAQSIVDFAWQKTKDLFHVSMGQLTEEQEKEKTSKSRWWGTGGLAVGAGVGTFACGVGSLFTAGAVGIACVAAAGTAGAGIGYVGRGTIYENNTVATNTAFLNTVTTLIVNHPEAFAVLGGSGFVKLVDMWVTKTKPIRDLNIQKTVMKKEVFDGAIGALAAAHPVSHMAFQGFKKGEDQLNTWINPEHVQLQKKVREGVDVVAKPVQQWVAKQAKQYQGDVDDGLDVEDDEEAFREWSVKDVLQILEDADAMKAYRDQVVAWLTWKRDKILRGAKKSRKIRGYLETFQTAPYKSVRAVFSNQIMNKQNRKNKMSVQAQ